MVEPIQLVHCWCCNTTFKMVVPDFLKVYGDDDKTRMYIERYVRGSDCPNCNKNALELIPEAEVIVKNFVEAELEKKSKK